jgi:hypothetical protein
MYDFTLILGGVGLPDEDDADALYKAGCDDALLGARDCIVYLGFDRLAASLAEAVLSAILDVHRAGYEVLRVEPDDLVTASEIARRLSRTRESVRQLMRGDRGPGGFPPPVSSVSGTSRLWSFLEVVAWFVDFHTDSATDPALLESARFVATVNAALARRRREPSPAAVSEMEEVLDGL